MSEVTRTGSNGEMVPRASEPSSLLNVIARAMEDERFDVSKLEALLRMQRELVAENARQEFSRAMSAAQGEMRAVFRDAANEQTHSRYAKLEKIDDAIRPIYTRHGFSLTFGTDQPRDPASIRVVCECAHSAGHVKTYELEAPPDQTGARGQINKTILHGMGSTITYLRRYLTTMIFNVVLTNEDDDGNAGGIAAGMAETVERRSPPRTQPQAARGATQVVDEIEAQAKAATSPEDLQQLERDDLVRKIREHLPIGRPQRDRMEALLIGEGERVAAFWEAQAPPADDIEDHIPAELQQPADADATRASKVEAAIAVAPSAEVIDKAILGNKSNSDWIAGITPTRPDIIARLERARQARIDALGSGSA